MAAIDGPSREVLERAEWVSIATAGPNGPHLAATWGDYIRKLGVDWEAGTLLVPVGGMATTAANLAADGRVEVMAASRDVAGSHGPGQGCLIRGRGEVQTAGALAERTRDAYAWARGVLVITVDEVGTAL